MQEDTGASYTPTGSKFDCKIVMTRALSSASWNRLDALERKDRGWVKAEIFSVENLLSKVLEGGKIDSKHSAWTTS